MKTQEGNIVIIFPEMRSLPGYASKQSRAFLRSNKMT